MHTLHWVGKEKVIKHHHEVLFKTLRQEYTFTAPEGTPANSTGNRIIHGDNLEALKKTVAGLGGAFEYFTIGEALFDDDGNINPVIPIEEIRRYVAYTEGVGYVGANGVRPDDNGNDGGNCNEGACHAPLQKTTYLGTSADAAYFFHYEPESATTLDYDYLATLMFPGNIRPVTMVIYADNCLLSADQLKKHGIIFKKIPRDLTRF